MIGNKALISCRHAAISSKSWDCRVTGRYSGRNGACDLSQWCDRKSPRIYRCHARDAYISRLEKSGSSGLFLQEMNVPRSCLRALYPALAWHDTEIAHILSHFYLFLPPFKFRVFFFSLQKAINHCCMHAILNKKLRCSLFLYEQYFWGFKYCLFWKIQRKSMLHHMTADLIMQFTAVNTLTWAYSLIIEDIPPTHGRSLQTSNNWIFWENLY